MSSREFSEWKAYAKIQPLRTQQLDYLVALLAKVIVDINKGKHGKKTELKDFMLKWDQEANPDGQSWEEQLAIVEALNAAFGGEDLRQPNLPESAYDIDDEPQTSKDTGE